MQEPSKNLFQELDRLKAKSSSLQQRLAHAAEQFRQSYTPLPENLASETADLKKSIANLGSMVVIYGRQLSLSPDLPVSTLDELDRSLQVIAAIEETRGIETKAKANALATLDRALCIVRCDRSLFPPLLKCQARVKELRDEIVGFSGPELHSAVKELVEGKHAVSKLLDLSENESNLSDDQYLKSEEMVAESFGKDLAIAAARRKLEIQKSPVSAVLSTALDPDVSSEKQFQQKTPPAPGAGSLRKVAEPQRRISNDPASGVKGDLDQEIEVILTSISELANKTTAGISTEDATDMKVGQPRRLVAQSTPKASSEAHAQGIPLSEEVPSAPPPTAAEAGGAFLEAIRLEEEADRCFVQGKHSEAEGLYQQLLATQKKLYGPRDPETDRTLRKITRIHDSQKAFGAAPIPRSVGIRKDEMEATRPELVGGTQGVPVRAMAFAVAMLAVVILVYAGFHYRTRTMELVPQQASDSSANNSPIPAPPPTQLEAATTPGQPMQEVPPRSVVPKQDRTAETISEQVRPPKAMQQPAETTVISKAKLPEVKSTPRPVQQPPPQERPNTISTQMAVKKVELEPPPQLGSFGEPRVTGKAVETALGALIPSASPEPVPPPPPPLERVRIGGQLAAAKLVSSTRPVYPQLARQNRIQGIVRVEAVISKDGRIEKLAVISGHQFLKDAAIDAVKQWRYQPTLLNGIPVEVITTIDVNFTLDK